MTEASAARTMDNVFIERLWRPLKYECVYAWLHAWARTLNIDPGRIAVLGESAGGGYAAMLSIAIRNRAEVPIAPRVQDCMSKGADR